MKLLIKYPCRLRLKNLTNLLQYLILNIKNKNTEIIISIDVDDKHIYNKESLKHLKPLLDNNKIKLFVSKSESKVDAYNRDLNEIQWTHLLCISDYVEFTTNGFDNIIIEECLRYASYPIKFQSSNQFYNQYHNLFIVPYKFYLSKKYIFNPCLKSNYHYELLTKELKSFYGKIHYSDIVIHKYVHSKWGYDKIDNQTLIHINNWRKDLISLENENSII